MKKIASVSILILWAFALAGAREAAPAEVRQNAQEAPQEKPKFDIFAFFTLADKDLDFFYKVPPNTVVIGTVSEVYRYERLLFLPACVNAVENDGDECGVKYRYLMRKKGSADAKVLLDSQTLKEKLPRKDSVILMPMRFIFDFEDFDELGEYEFIFEAENLLKGEKLEKTVPITLKEWTTPKPEEGAEDMSREIQKFTEGYLPDRLYLIFNDPSVTYMQKESGVNYAAYSFFRHAFKKHDFLLKVLADEFVSAPAEKRLKTLILFASLEELARLKGATEAEEIILKDVMDVHEKNSTLVGSGLDTLWGEFFATGRFEPFEKIFDSVSCPDEIRALLEKLKDREADIPEDVLMKGIKAATAAWSLKGNYNQNKLLKNYMHFKFQTLPKDKLDLFMECDKMSAEFASLNKQKLKP